MCEIEKSLCDFSILFYIQSFCGTAGISSCSLFAHKKHFEYDMPKKNNLPVDK